MNNSQTFHSNRWEFEESEEDPVTSIPYQLQRLFVLLQTSKKRAIETTDVTRSFGWDSSEGTNSLVMISICNSQRNLRDCIINNVLTSLLYLFIAFWLVFKNSLFLKFKLQGISF